MAISLAAATVFGTAALTVDQFAFSRALVWGDADVDDWRRFPSRVVRAKPGRPLAMAPDGLQIAVSSLRAPSGASLSQFLESTQTTAFLVLRKGQLLTEAYFNGSSHSAVQTSFSVAKSFVSTLIGIALAEGYIASLDDPITTYLPELAERDSRLTRITLRNLLQMASGLRFTDEGLPWTDDTLTYYDPDLRRLALTNLEVIGPPGVEFEYNPYNTLLLGIVLERATGTPVSNYLETRLWQPLGMEADASWSLDSEQSGFEKMESGLNGRAVDFARLGLLYLADGEWDGEQIVPAEWIASATSAWTNEAYAGRGYGLHWWVLPPDDVSSDSRYVAIGNKGQYIFVAPMLDLVIVRFGRDFGYEDWPDLLDDLAQQIAQRAG